MKIEWPEGCPPHVHPRHMESGVWYVDQFGDPWYRDSKDNRIAITKTNQLETMQEMYWNNYRLLRLPEGAQITVEVRE